MSSIRSSSFKSEDVIFIAFVAASAFAGSFHKIAEQPSGEITENTEYLIIANLSATPIAKAPPEPPSPITIDTVGVFNSASSSKFLAIASD